MPAVELAEQIGVSQAQLYMYERGESSPSPDVLAKLSDRLRLPRHYFVKPTAGHFASDNLLYRAKAATSQSERDRAEQRIQWLAEIVDSLVDYVDFPDLNMPPLDHLPADPRALTNDMVDHLAAAVRSEWGLDDLPVPNVVRAMEANGVVVGFDDFAGTDLDGLSGWSRTTGRPFALLSRKVESAVRIRLSAAHELGELVLHRHVVIDEPTSKHERALRKRMDEQAYRFAGAFLLPEEAFLADLSSVTLDTLCAIKPKWKVSIGAMILRLRALDLLSDGTYRDMQIQLSRRGWRLEEPYDDSIPPERPVLLEQAIGAVIDEGLMTAEDLVYRTALDEGTLERLSNLPPGLLSETDAPSNIIVLRSK